MSAHLGKSTVLNFSKKIANSLLTGIEGRFSIGVFNEGLSDLHPYSDSYQELETQIDTIPQSYSGTDLLKAIEEVIRIVKSKDNGQKINLYVLSDFSGNLKFDNVKQPFLHYLNDKLQHPNNYLLHSP